MTSLDSLARSCRPKFSLNSIYYARKIIYDELMPVLFVSPNKLVYTGSDQPLVNESEWVSGMIKYLLGDARKWFLTENDRYYDLIDYFEYLPEAPMMYDLAGSYEADDSEFMCTLKSLNHAPSTTGCPL